MTNIMMGSPHSEKQISILIFLLNKIHVEQFNTKKLDEILDLFVVIYLKCTQAVQLTFVDDIDKCMQLIKEASNKIFVERTFKYKVVLHGLH